LLVQLTSVLEIGGAVSQAAESRLTAYSARQISRATYCHVTAHKYRRSEPFCVVSYSIGLLEALSSSQSSRPSNAERGEHTNAKSTTSTNFPTNALVLTLADPIKPWSTDILVRDRGASRSLCFRAHSRKIRRILLVTRH
jgi:hypothetical protein